MEVNGIVHYKFIKFESFADREQRLHAGTSRKVNHRRNRLPYHSVQGALQLAGDM